MVNKIFISVDFEPKIFDRKLVENQKNRPNFFGSKLAETKGGRKLVIRMIK